VKGSKLLLRFSLTSAFVFCVFGFLAQSTGPLLADGALAPELVSYSPGDAMPSPRGSMVSPKTIRMACYPARARCAKDSDCCTGHCTSGARGAWASASYCTK
jgi:hypothetical protein